jgi:hypothetical protein
VNFRFYTAVSVSTRLESKFLLAIYLFLRSHCYSYFLNSSPFFADGILLGGILFMYEFHNYLRPILLLVYSFWIPQIITNVVRDSRKPLHPHYILGITVTRLAIPLYVFGCPNNFLRIEPDQSWCVCLIFFTGFQAAILLLQHYLGSRWFIPHQVESNSCLNTFLPT